MRLFIALLLPEQIRDELAKNARDLRQYCTKGNFSAPENYHLTLRFLGECREDQLPDLQKAVATAAGVTARFTLQLGACGSFPKGQQLILWRAIQQPYPQLSQLASRVEQALFQCGWPQEMRKFSPHITLARQAVLTKPLSELPLKLSTLSFAASQIAVMESCRIEGKLTYLPLAVSPLI